ncbi:hypothetical protein PQQ53_10805 [Paraburkholderia strydomiana]|jgi:hypothetical protein|uniref:hypothetical protein n=1 Tax=Paraburkholderia strydomiana TaxID=1245417 RepID=UPI0038BA9714
MLPFLSLHALAAQRGDGLRPELKALFEHHAGLATGLTAAIEPVETECFSQPTGDAGNVSLKECGADGPTASVSCLGESGQ